MSRTHYKPFWRDHPYFTAVALVVLFIPFVLIAAAWSQGIKTGLVEWMYLWKDNWRTR
jgi:succinate dehydrogenase hydrophobic anchor subunit